ncbi:MAG TPA: protein kinase [Byssovorax sp.]|jgi:serine/threonine-protein kinase
MSNPNSQASGADLAPGTVIDGRYKVVKSLGQGGNGLVHEVEHVRTGRHLALKSLLDESGQGRLEQEARATCLLKNAHAARITDMGSAAPVGPYLVMELLVGQSLRDLLDEAGQLPLELVANIMLQVCECLAEAHKHGIVHRDLKPENVFLSPSAWPGQHEVTVLDFGVVKIGSEGPIPHASLTRTGSTVGTPYYMSLEQLRNSSAVDARADIYALGVVAYECLSGRKPFQADTIGDLVYALCSGPPTDLARLRPDLPAEVTAVIMRALAMKKEDRPATTAELGAALIPHGNQAYGLWVRVDGKQPALAARPGAAPGKPAPPRGPKTTAVMVPRPGAAIDTSRPPGVPEDPTTNAQTIPKPIFPMAPKPRPPGVAAPLPQAAPAALWTDAALEGGPAPVDETTTGARPRHDTPTEMFRKDEHAAPEPPSGGDRDTPTRAIPAAAFQEDARVDTQSLKPFAAADEPTGDLPGVFPPRAPVIGNRTMPMPADMKPLVPDMAMLQTLPAQATAHASFPDAQLPPHGAALQLAQLPPPSSLDAPLKPGWQLALDRAVVQVSRSIDTSIAKFKASPPKTRALVLVCIASIAVFLVVLVSFLVVH